MGRSRILFKQAGQEQHAPRYRAASTTLNLQSCAGESYGARSQPALRLPSAALSPRSKNTQRALMALDARIHEVPDDLLAAIDYCYEQGWTDGLPVVPPTIERVHAMLASEGRPPEAVIATYPATALELSVHAAAVNAVM